MRLLVHEPASFWTAEFERSLASVGRVSVRWFPRAADLLAEADATDVVILALPAGEAGLRLITDLHRRVRAILCLVGEVSTEWEWTAREAGADSLIPETTGCEQVWQAVAQLLFSDGE